ARARRERSRGGGDRAAGCGGAELMAATRFPRLLRRLTAGVPSHGFAIAHASERTSTLATKLAEQAHAFAKTVAAIRRDATLSALGRATKVAMAAEQTRDRIEKMRSEF